LRTVAFDWDGKAVHVSEDGILEHVYDEPDQFVLLARFLEPTQFVTESTIESYDPDRRRQTIEGFASAGHDLRTISPRLTGWWRAERGLPKSNAQDAVAIYHIATNGRTHLKRPSLDVDEAWTVLREEAEYEIMVLRRSGRKDLLWERLVERLPRFRDLTPIRQRALGAGGNYSKSILPAVYVAATYTRNNIKAWERLMGLYGAGKNSQFRSDVYNWGLAPKLTKVPVPGQTTATGRPKMRVKTPIEIEGMTKSDYRRELRWLYRQVRRLEIHNKEDV
jgi:hypothetical protein